MSENGSDKKPSDPLSDLDARLKQLRADRAGGKADDSEVPSTAMSGLGAAFRIGTELVGALIAGLGIGYFLDRWLGTAPWLLVVFFFLGSAAGILNVYRAVGGREFGEGFKAQDVAKGSQTGDAEGESDKQI